MLELLSDGTIIASLVSLFLCILGYKMKSLPVLFISSIGWTIVALRVFQEVNDFFPTVLLLMVAFAQFYLVSKN